MRTPPNQVLRTVIVGHGAQVVHSGILRAIIAARLLAVPNHHELGRVPAPSPGPPSPPFPIGANLLPGSRP
jgi:hypothetical protein